MCDLFAQQSYDYKAYSRVVNYPVSRNTLATSGLSKKVLHRLSSNEDGSDVISNAHMIVLLYKHSYVYVHVPL